MVDVKPSSVLTGVFIIIIGIVVFKYVGSVLDPSSDAGAIFSVIFFVAVFYLVFRFFRKR